MATRQRVRSSRKAPVVPPQPPADDDNTLTSADAPGIAQTAQEDMRTEPPPQARFVGEQVIYKSREDRIAESAYLYAEARGFAPGYELEDWLQAEKEVDSLLSGREYPAG